MAATILKSFPLPEEAICPVCENNIKLYDPAGSEFCICGSCNSYLQFVDEEPQKIKTVIPNQYKTVIPIGSTGTLKDIPFIVTGYLERKEKDSDYYWIEYVLYNYEKGYAMLSEYDGHWNIIFGKNFLPELKLVGNYSKTLVVKGVTYKLFHKYAPKTTSLSGEFDWDILSENIQTSEFIAPPYIIAKETSVGRKNKKINYYQGEYMEPEIVAAAFGLDIKLFFPKTGILSNQPSSAYKDWMWSLLLSLCTMIILLVTVLVMNQIKPEQILMDKEFSLTYEPLKGQFEFKPIMTSSFEVKDPSSSLEIQIRSNVSNNWLEATIVLVNEANNQTWEVTKGVEHYSGVEDGESWSEGDTQAEILLSEIPKGKYHFNIYPASGDPARDNINVSVTANGILWRNIVMSILLLSIIPICNYFRMWFFEQKRWSYSDYSPFEK